MKGYKDTIADYKVRYDGTSLDNFIINLLNFLSPENPSVKVSGLLNGLLTKNKCKSYKVRLSYSYEEKDSWGFYELFPEKTDPDIFSSGNISEYYVPGTEMIEKKLKSFIVKNKYDISCRYSQGGFRYVNLLVTLPFSYIDLMTHCRTSLTEFGEENLAEITKIFKELSQKKKYDLESLYKQPSLIPNLARKAENLFRLKIGIPKIGEGWVKENKLFSLISEHFPKAKKQQSPKWLGLQKFDIYIPSLKVAIEYNGEQHFKPMKHFGGEEGFKKNQERDLRKRELALKNGVKVIEWNYDKPVNRKNVALLIEDLKSLNFTYKT
jgi:hypothetical protein